MSSHIVYGIYCTPLIDSLTFSSSTSTSWKKTTKSKLLHVWFKSHICSKHVKDLFIFLPILHCRKYFDDSVSIRDWWLVPVNWQKKLCTAVTKVSQTSLRVADDTFPWQKYNFFAKKVNFLQYVNFWAGNEVGRRYLTCSH